MRLKFAVFGILAVLVLPDVTNAAGNLEGRETGVPTRDKDKATPNGGTDGDEVCEKGRGCGGGKPGVLGIPDKGAAKDRSINENRLFPR